MAESDPIAQELQKAYEEAFATVEPSCGGDFLDHADHVEAAIRAVLARYRFDDPDPRMVETIARRSGESNYSLGAILLAVLKTTRVKRGPIAKPVDPISEVLQACAVELERVGRPWSRAFRDEVLKIADERLPRRNLRRDSRAAAALLKALRHADQVAHSTLKGNPNFRWWVERVVRPLLEDEEVALECYARSFAEPLTVLRQLVMVYDSANFLGLGRAATNRELAAFCLLCRAVPPRGTGRREPSFGDVIRYAQSIVIKARRQAGLPALLADGESPEFPSPINRRHVHALALGDLRRAGFVPPAPAVAAKSEGDGNGDRVPSTPSTDPTSSMTAGVAEGSTDRDPVPSTP